MFSTFQLLLGLFGQVQNIAIIDSIFTLQIKAARIILNYHFNVTSSNKLCRELWLMPIPDCFVHRKAVLGLKELTK